MTAQPKWYIILNPAANNGNAGKSEAKIIATLQQNDISFVLVKTERPKHAAILAREAIAAGFRCLAAVGGDGTANEVINGIFTQTIVETTAITYAILPIGTGNDFIRTHHIPNHFAQAIPLLKNPKTILHDIGVVEYQKKEAQAKHFFINVAGFAYDAFVTRASHEQTNPISNKAFYLWLIFKCLFRYEPQKLRLQTDTETIDDHFYNVAIGICKYNGGGAIFVPHADPTDGLLALTLIRKVSKLNVIQSTPMFYNGKIGEHPATKLLQSKTIHITGNTEVEVDGEILGTAPATVSILPAALKVVVP